MRIVITGGGGFLGQRVAAALLARGGLAQEPGAPSALDEIVLVDQAMPEHGVSDPRIRKAICDISDRAYVQRLFAPPVDAVFHLAAVVSAGAEADFDLGYRVNLDAARFILEACRQQPRAPRLVFASSVAAFGGELPHIVSDDAAVTPQSSYGTQKVIGELLINDYTRKGFLDGRTVRLPTIVVRPGKPNRAASGFMSNILREPLKGEPAVCPVPRETAMWIASPARAVDALIRAMELPAPSLGMNRTLNAPGITVSVAEALAALERIAGRECAARVGFEPDAAIARIVTGWPVGFATVRAQQLGFVGDSSIDAVIQQHIDATGR